MSIYTICKVLKVDEAYANYALVSSQRQKDIATMDDEAYGLELGGEYLSAELYGEDLIKTKNLVVQYINKRANFFIFDFDEKKMYTNVPSLEGFVSRALTRNEYSLEIIAKEEIRDVVERILPERVPTLSDDLLHVPPKKSCRVL